MVTDVSPWIQVTEFNTCSEAILKQVKKEPERGHKKTNL